ncbi:MAG TPA: HEAT repeat domain-containing protein, partial [Pyrinomonadaceae bacterium]
MRRLQILSAGLLLVAISVTGLAQRRNSPGRTSAGAIPTGVLLRIIKAEDERRWSDDLSALLTDQNAQVRRRAALAAGRIGDDRAVPSLADMVLTDRDVDVRQMAAFALGEIESPGGGYALTSVLKNTSAPGRARAVEALGKITAAMANSVPAPAGQSATTKTEDDRLDIFRAAIFDALRFEVERRSAPDRLTILLGLTAALRARPEGAGPLIAQFLSFPDPRIRADALNTLSRLKFKEGNEQARKLLIADPDPIVRANAARVLGATEDKAAFEALLDRALKDTDLRVRVSAIRALGSLKDARATEPLLQRASRLSVRNPRGRPTEANEVLELATALGRIAQGTRNVELLSWLKVTRETFDHTAPELEIAIARVSPLASVAAFSSDSLTERKFEESIVLNWKAGSSRAQGLGEIAAFPNATKDNNLFGMMAKAKLRAMLDYRNSGIRTNRLIAGHSEYAIPDVLRAFAAFKSTDLRDVLLNHLKESDVITRATAAELLGELPPDETNVRALTAALPAAMADKDLNDAALAILDALGKQKTATANEAIKTALDSPDHLLRRKAVALLKANGVGDFSSRIGTVKTRNTNADYRRAIARIGKHVTATVVTSKGSFTIEFLPEDAPLTVDNFVQLARKGFFNGQTIPRVVPNFVVQAGDPRGD